MKKIINFDFTNGTTVSEDDVSFYFNVLNDDALFIQFVRIYFEEVEKKLYVLFDIKINLNTIFSLNLEETKMKMVKHLSH